MSTMTPAPSPARNRRPRRLGIDAHTEFVGTLVSELDSAVARLRAADPAAVDRPAGDILRLVRLLEAIDGPGDRRRLKPVSLVEVVERASRNLDVRDLDVGISVGRGAAPDPFIGDVESLVLGMEFVLLAFTGGGGRLSVRFPNDRLAVVEGRFDLADELQAWRLRCGRRVLEGEKCRIRLVGGRDGCRLEIRAFGS